MTPTFKILSIFFYFQACELATYKKRLKIIKTKIITKMIQKKDFPQNRFYSNSYSRVHADSVRVKEIQGFNVLGNSGLNEYPKYSELHYKSE